MQRYRVNMPLLLSLVIGAVVTLGGLFGLWKYQLNRNAGALKDQAEAAIAEGDIRKAALSLSQYSRIRQEDVDSRVQLANLLHQILETESDVNNSDFANAHNSAEAALRDKPDDQKLRQRQIDLLLKFGNAKNALDHIDILLNQDPSRTDLKTKRVQCLGAVGRAEEALKYASSLVGYDPVADEFDITKAGAPKEPTVYRTLSQLLRSDNQAAIADRVMDQMIEANPESAEAYVFRAQYRAALNDEKGMEADANKALELDPDNIQANLIAVSLAAKAKEFDKAREILERSIAKHPKEVSLYAALAQVELQGSTTDPTQRKASFLKAIEQLQRGINTINDRTTLELIYQKASIQLDSEDLEGGKKSIELLKAENANPALVSLLNSRLLMAEYQWSKAAKELELLRPVLANDFDTNIQVNLLLGLCREKLGQWELAREAYDLVIGVSSTDARALAGRERVQSQAGPTGDQEEDSSIYSLFQKEMDKPEAARDWAAFNKEVEAYCERFKISEANRLLLQAEFLMKRDLFDRAVAKLKAARELDPDNVSIQRLVIRLMAANPKYGPAQAIAQLEKIKSKFGDSPMLRVDEADLRMSINDSELAQQLLKLTEGIEDWSTGQQALLYTEIAKRLTQINEMDAAKICWEKVVEITPGDLMTLMQLFSAAQAQGNDAEMKSIQDKLLKIVSGKEDATWLYTDACRAVVAAQQAGFDSQLGKTEAARARELINRCRSQRAEWNQPVLLLAELELLSKNADAALAALDEASKLGRMTVLASAQHIQLMLQAGRIADSRAAMERLTPALRDRLMGRQYAEVLLAQNEPQKALEAADAVIKATTVNGETQLWYGRFLMGILPRLGKPLEQVDPNTPPKLSPEQEPVAKKAGEALLQAVELMPESADAWLARIAFLGGINDRSAAEDAIRDARIAVPEDQQPLMLARCFEAVGRWFDAENLYRDMLEADPNSPALVRQLVQFYMGPGYRRPDRVTKSTTLVNRVLKLVTDGKVKIDDPSVQWARRTAAQMLSASGEYQNLLKAEKLLASNAQNGVLSSEDKIQMARLLAPRPEPLSRVKATKLLEEIDAASPLPPDLRLVLGQLYYAIGRWDECKRAMVQTLAENPEFAAARDTYVRILLKHGQPEDIREARRQLNTLTRTAATSSSTLELIARVATAEGKQAEAVAALQRLLPDLGKADAKIVPLVLQIASLLTDLEDFANAEKLYQFAVSKSAADDPSASLLYATFLGAQAGVEPGLKKIAEIKAPGSELRGLQTALAILRSRPDEVLKYAPQVQQMIDRMLRDDPDSIQILLQQAELFDLSRRPEEAAGIYRKLLKREDLTGFGRAVVMNNLAFLLTLGDSTPEQLQEAKKMIDQAAEILGPQADLLDTRAIVYDALGEHALAVEDLQYSVTDNPTASKYFHLAGALLNAKQEADALAAWDKALELGLKLEKLPLAEQDRFRELEKTLEGLRGRSAAN